MYIIPALSLTDKKQKIDCKWSPHDLTYFARHSQTPDIKPTSVVWWQTLESNQNALVGYENGAIALISLTDGRCLGCCAISEGIVRLALCQDNKLDSVSLLVSLMFCITICVISKLIINKHEMLKLEGFCFYLLSNAISCGQYTKPQDNRSV